MLEFEIGGNNYRASKLNAFQQLHVSRKLAGVLPKVLPAILAATEATGDIASVLTACEPAMEAVAAMPEGDVDFVFHTCLSVVSREQGTAWSPVWNQQAKVLQFGDIDLTQMTQIVFRVVKDSLGNFIHGLIAEVPAVSPAATA